MKDIKGFCKLYDLNVPEFKVLIFELEFSIPPLFTVKVELGEKVTEVLNAQGAYEIIKALNEEQ